MSPRLRVAALLLLSSRAWDFSDAATNSFSDQFFFRTTNAIAAVDDSVGVVGEGRSSPEDHSNAAATFFNRRHHGQKNGYEDSRSSTRSPIPE